MVHDSQREALFRKCRQVFTFLKALDEHRNPVKRQVADQLWRMPLSQLPQHPDVDLVYPVDDIEVEGGGRGLQPRDYILRVRRPHLIQPPEPPEAHREWVLSGWEDPFKKVTLHAERPVALDHTLPGGMDEAETGAKEAFEADPARVEALATWQVARDQWATKERPATQAMELFERLYGLHGTLARVGDEMELVFGDGMLNWRVPSGGIHHPLLLQRAELHFNPDRPEFTIVEAEAPVELYTALLRNVEGLDGGMLASLRQELEAGEVSPLQGRAASAYLRRMTASLSARGEFLEAPPGSGEEDWPRVWREPFLFARRRSLGFATAIERILQNLDQREDVPAALGRIVGFEGEPAAPEIHRERPVWSESEEILLSREANPEQIRVAERIDRSSSIVVQGPPGTGKTHTIANLIGHLLAQGKSVLVTSHTAKALSVLLDQVVKPLQPLCISALGHDADSRRRLEHSVNGMVEHLSTADPKDLEMRARSMAERRNQLISEIDTLRQRAIESRKGEYRPVTVGGRSLDPARAAREAAAQRHENEWLPGPVAPGDPLPLSPEEIAELYRTNEILSADDEAELSCRLPERDGLPTSEEVRTLAESLHGAGREDRFSGAEFWRRPVAEKDASSLKEVISGLADAVAKLEGPMPWWSRLVEVALRGDSASAPWRRLLEEIEAFAACLENAAEPRYRYGPRLPDLPLDEQVKTVEEILSYLDRGRALSWVNRLTKPAWRRFIDGALIRDVRPSRIEHFQALHAQILAALKGRQVAERWQRMAVPAGLPATDASDPNLDRKLLELRRAIESALSWPGKIWGPTLEHLGELGFDWQRFTAKDEPQLSETPELDRLRKQLERLSLAVEARWRAAHWAYLERRRLEFEETASRLRNTALLPGIARRLAQALATLNASGYESARRELERLEGLVAVRDRRAQLLERLTVAAQNWAARIRLRSEVHGGATPPGDPQRAWQWRQIEEELDRRSQESLAELQQAIQTRSREVRHATSALIEHRAWAAQCRRINLETQQALIGWQSIVRRIPKKSSVPGKLTRLRRAAQEAIQRCRSAVPVWIMPLTRVAETFDFAKTRFDVVIIDEASQTDVMGLLVYYIAGKILVVGDHEQVSPAAVGQKDEVVQQLIQEHLQGIPNADLYDGKTSIYDLARQAAEGAPTCLLEHFRCASEIIQFSNDLCYDGAIKPLRNPSSLKLVPNVIPYRVTGPFNDRRQKVNPAEAEAVASLVAACTEQREYKDLSMGVISMVGEEQAIEIDLRLQARLSPADYERRRLVCGSSAQFQGDQRDVMFLSMVDSPIQGPLPMRDQPMFRQRFNVAASRARDQMWVIHSLDPTRDLKPGDLRRRLIEHAIAPQALVRKLDRIETETESELERLVARRLVDRGYRVIPQYKVGYYRIDLVVEGAGRQLAVECDGDRFHPPEKLGEDMARQATLERLGWSFVRVRGTQFFRDPERAMRPAFEALNRLEIPPEARTAEDQQRQLESPLDHALVQRVVNRAAELRQEWSGGTADTSDRGGENDTPGPSGGTEGTSGSAASTTSPTRSRQPTGKDNPLRSPARKLGFSRTRQTSDSSTSSSETKTSGRAHPFPGRAAEAGNRDVQAQVPRDEDHRADLPELQGDVWLALSHWAKVNNRFASWERGVLYSIGIYLKKSWRISAKQAKHGQRLFDAALKGGFDPTIPPESVASDPEEPS